MIMVKLSTICLSYIILFGVLGLRILGANELEDIYYVVIGDGSNCSSLPTELQRWECHPLSFYIKNVNKYFTNNTKMLFTEGTHQLPLPPDAQTPVVNVTGIANFSMIGTGRVKYSETPSEVGSLLPSSVISCINPKEEDQTRNGILFYKTSSILIVNLTVEDCGAKFTVQRPDNFPLVSALTFRESYDINLTQVRIDKSLGFGLDADRIYGSFSVQRSVFLRSKAYRLQYNKNVGGNARFWYSEYNTSSVGIANLTNVLHINNSWFMHGYMNRYAHSSGYNFASGLIIRIFIPSVNVTINNVTLNNNTGTHGGNLAVLVTDFHGNTGKITISDSTIANGSATRGGGMQFWIQIDSSENFDKLNIHNHHTIWQDHEIMNITRTAFVNNSAQDSGGGIYIGHYPSIYMDYTVRYISFKDCVFSNNSVKYKQGKTITYTGAAVEIIRHNIDDLVPHTVPQYSVEFSGCSFEYNVLKDVTNEGGILDLVSTQSVIITDCNFTFNEGTAVSLKQSNIKFYGHTTFQGNKGRHGGALKFCELSKMYLPNNTRISFIENQATVTGGAIYTSEQLCLETAPACFFQPVRHKNSAIDKLNITLHFINNTARYAGDAVYGGQVDHCYLYYSNYDNGSTYLSKRVFEQIFDLTDQKSSQSKVSSPPYGACFYNVLIDELECESKTYSGLHPGQTITLHLIAVGQHNGTSPVRYNSFQLKQSPDSCCSELEMRYANNSYTNKKYALLKYVIYSNQSVVTFNLTVLQASLAELRYVHYPTHQLTIKLEDCPWGFKLSKDKPYTCNCDPLLLAQGTPCDINNKQIMRWGQYWIGCGDKTGNSHKSDNMQNTTVVGDNCKVMLAKNCLKNYCNATNITITSSTLDDQCTEGREGILCGRCKANYSLALGTQRCLPSCPVYMVYIVVLTCAAGGIMLILFLIVCNFTVSEGTINGLFFYAHVVHKNAYTFFSDATDNSNTNIFRLFIAWLNLDIGFEVCFYKSMDQYQKVWLEFGFLFYIWVLIFLIVMLSRRFIFFTRLVGRNVVKVIATLSLVCFPRAFNITLTCLELVYVRQAESHKIIVWQPDGNIKYLKGKHIPLFILGISLVIFSLLFTLSLLFIQCLQRNSNFFCLSWVNRLRPFFDAYTGPCHLHYRFWPGCLFFVRLVLFTLNASQPDQYIFNLYIVLTACVVVLIGAFVMPHGVYRRWTLNVLEAIFFINLGTVSGRMLYHSSKHHNSVSKIQYIVDPSVALTMVLFAGILFYHCSKQLQSYGFCKKLSLSAITNRLGIKKLKHGLQRESDEEREPFLQEDMHQVISSTDQYREELIND